jgi:hypothetical protein
MILTLVLRKTSIFCRKLVKLAENCDHTNDPWNFESVTRPAAGTCRPFAAGIPDKAWAGRTSRWPRAEIEHRILKQERCLGVNVMIAIFGDFCQYLAYTMTFLSKNNVMM